MTEMQSPSELQDFGRWGQPVPRHEFGRGFPQPTAQDFGRWGQPVPVQEFGNGWPLPAQDFGKTSPSLDQGWRSPAFPFPPIAGRYLVH